MSEADTSNAERIRKLEEDLTFLDDHVAKQDQEILNLQKKLDRITGELKELREHFGSGALNSGAGDERPPHY